MAMGPDSELGDCADTTPTQMTIAMRRVASRVEGRIAREYYEF
jgi:hypothetical protein